MTVTTDPRLPQRTAEFIVDRFNQHNLPIYPADVQKLEAALCEVKSSLERGIIPDPAEPCPYMGVMQNLTPEMTWPDLLALTLDRINRERGGESSHHAEVVDLLFEIERRAEALAQQHRRAELEAEWRQLRKQSAESPSISTSIPPEQVARWARRNGPRSSFWNDLRDRVTFVWIFG